MQNQISRGFSYISWWCLLACYLLSCPATFSGKLDSSFPEIMKSDFGDSIAIPFEPLRVVYPDKGKFSEKRCVVWLRIFIGAKGVVASAEVISCSTPDYGFEKAAIRAVEYTRFGAKWDGPYPVDYVGYYPVSYTDPYLQRGPWPEFRTKYVGVGLDAPLLDPVKMGNMEYPKIALGRLIEADVYLKVLIDQKGKPKNIKALYSTVKDMGFEKAAAKVIKGSVFQIKKVSRKKTKYRAYTMVSFRFTDEQIGAAGLPGISDEIMIDEAAEVVYEPAQKVPIHALYAGISDSVWLKALVDSTGRVVTARLYSPSEHIILNDAALSDAKRKQYRSAIRDGKPVSAWIKYPVYYFGRFKQSEKEEITQKKTKNTQWPVYEHADVEHPEVLPKFKHFQRAIYPAQLDRDGVTGRVKIAVLIGVDGEVLEIRVPRSSGNEMLDSAATASVEKIIFEPGLIEDKPVKSWTSWVIDFSPYSKTVISQIREDKIELPEMIYERKPIYPQSTDEDGIEGRVWLRIHVSKDGSVLEAEVYKSSGLKSLDAAALEAAPFHKFKPATKNGEQVSFWFMYLVEFIIGNELD